jgi:hypothetical protein
MRKRERRADRIVPMLASKDFAVAAELRKTPYGLLNRASEAFEVSKATASRDFALVRRIHRQFLRMYGRSFDPKRDNVVWDWHRAHYGFMTPESRQAGYKKAVGQFPFDTRKQETEESYCGFNQSSWHRTTFISQMSTRELIRAYGRLVKMRDRLRIPKTFFENYVRQLQIDKLAEK